MSEQHEEFKQIDIPAGTHLERCPVCGAKAELWRFSESKDAPTSTAVMCENGKPFGPQEAMIDEGCLLNMPPSSFYKARMTLAVSYWNEYAKALNQQRRKRNWEHAKVLREGATA